MRVLQLAALKNLNLEQMEVGGVCGKDDSFALQNHEQMLELVRSLEP